MNKQLLAAGIVRDFRFSSYGSYIAYLRGLDNRKQTFQVVENVLCEDNTILARIVFQYNGSPLIELPQMSLQV